MTGDSLVTLSYCWRAFVCGQRCGYFSESQECVEKAGGAITKPLFDFPGGCRFHFVEPGGNELAVWSESAK